MVKYEGIFYLTIIMGFSAIAAAIFQGLFPIEDVSLYLTVAGLIYGLLAAFAISVSWDRRSRIVENLHEEMSTEANIHELLKHVSDKKIANALNKQLLDYLATVTNVSWSEYASAERVHKKFRKLFEIFGKMNIKNEKDAQLFDDIGDELKDASKARNQQIVLSSTPLTISIWALLLFLSSAVVVGVFLVQFTSPVLGIFTKFTMSLSSFMILFVLHQIDALELSAEEIEEKPVANLVKIIKRE